MGIFIGMPGGIVWQTDEGVGFQDLLDRGVEAQGQEGQRIAALGDVVHQLARG
jgi:hypothetical protein